MCPRLKSALLSPKKAEKQDPKRTVSKLHNCIPEHCLLTCIASKEKYAVVLISNHFYVTGLFSLAAFPLWLVGSQSCVISGNAPCWSLLAALSVAVGNFHALMYWSELPWRHSQGRPSADPASCCLLLCSVSISSSAWVRSLCPVPGICSPDSKPGEP